MGKVVEIPADMTARDLCQLLVYKSHCVDDNSWALVEHHPLLGLGKWQYGAGPNYFTCTQNHTLYMYAHTFPYKSPWTFGWSETCNMFTDKQVNSREYRHACLHTYADRRFRHIFSRRHVFKHECMHILYYTVYALTEK